LGSKEKKQGSSLWTFLEKNEIWAFGKGVTIDQIRKELVFRLFSKVAYEEGWVFAPMPIFSLTDPEGRKRYGLSLLPESLSIFSLFQPASFPGWSLQWVSSDISWLFCKEGTLMALNPEIGVFGRLLGPISPSLRKNLFVDSLFSEVSVTAEKALWWEGKEAVIPWKLFDGKGKEWNRKKQNSFFASPSNSFLAEANLGVPISMIIVPTLKKSMYPLVCEGRSWEEGMLMMALLSSEKAKPIQGSLSLFDPFGMRDFCGVPLGEYIQKWFDMGDSLSLENRCRFFTVNLAAQEALPRPLMPTFKWCFERCEERRETPVTAFGYIPAENAIDTTSIEPSSSYAELFQKDSKEWRKELLDLRLFLRKWEDSLPSELISQLLYSLNGRVCDIPSNDQSFEDF
jgi:GTP-dependent phosphoenolpyruvate carboxykinase